MCWPSRRSVKWFSWVRAVKRWKKRLQTIVNLMFWSWNCEEFSRGFSLANARVAAVNQFIIAYFLMLYVRAERTHHHCRKIKAISRRVQKYFRANTVLHDDTSRHFVAVSRFVVFLIGYRWVAAHHKQTFFFFRIIIIKSIIAHPNPLQFLSLVISVITKETNPLSEIFLSKISFFEDKPCVFVFLFIWWKLSIHEKETISDKSNQITVIIFLIKNVATFAATVN